MVCLLAWIDSVLCVCFLISVLVHELGHLIAMNLLDVPIKSVRLQFSGAVIESDTMEYGKEVWISAAGPAASALLAALTMRWNPQIALIAAVHCTINLLPMYPLDGGRLARIAAYQFLPQHAADRVLFILSAGTACLLMLLACWWTVCLQAGIWPIFAALVILWRIGQASVSDQTGTSRLLFRRKTDTI